MSLSKIGLKDKIETELNNITDPTEANTKFGEAIADYIKDNAEITYTWAAIDGGGNPDPIISCNGEIISLTITLSPTGATNATTAMSELSTTLTASLKLGTHNVTDTGFTVTPGLMSDISNLNLTVSNKSNSAEAIEYFSNEIITWITSYVPGTPLNGSHGSYTGTATATKIE